MREKIDILHCVDGKDRLYLELMEMSLISFREVYDDEVRFHVIYKNVSEEDRKKLVSKYAVTFYPFPEKFEKDVREFGRLLPKVVHPSIFYRLFCHEILPKSIKYVFHIDTDIITLSRIRIPFFDKKTTIIKGMNYYKSLPLSRKRLMKKYKCDPYYINGGFNWLNLESMREMEYHKECMRLALEDGEFQYEEDLMNVVSQGSREIVEQDDKVMQHVMYNAKPPRDGNNSLLHVIFFKRGSGNLIHPFYKKIFNKYYKQVTGRYWDFSVPLKLKPFRYVPYFIRDLIVKREKLS